ncbi:MAG: DNA gyrase inhibitor YacG [Candidatus Acidiferrales bacterium]
MIWHCPICRKPTDSESDKDFPFCSERCRLTDLGNWSSEKYKISEPAADESLPDAPPSGKSISESHNSPARDESQN